MKRKLFALLFALVMVLQTAAPAFAAVKDGLQAKSEGDFTYSISGSEVTITGYNTEPSGKLTIPTEIDSKPVTTIGDSAFSSCVGITEVDMPSVVTIEGNAFCSCEKIVSINAPELVTIGENAFECCYALKTLSLPKVETIGDYAFSCCYALETVTLPKVKTIGEQAFYDNDTLETVIMPVVDIIGYQAFYSCDNLITAWMPWVMTLDDEAFSYCTKLEMVEFQCVNDVGDSVFTDCENLDYAYFYGAAPATCGEDMFNFTGSSFAVYHPAGGLGWDASCYIWKSYNTEEFTPIRVTFVDSITDSSFVVLKTHMHGDLYAPNAPEHTGYTFSGWDKSLSDITADMTVRALYTTEGLIPTIELTDVQIPAPIGGKAGDYLTANVPTGAHYTVYGVYWWDDTSGNWLDNEDTFTDGHSYSTQIFVQPDTGYSFDDTTELYINGSKSNVDLSFCQILSSGRYEVWTTSNPSEVISMIIPTIKLTGVTIPAPVGGKAGDYLTANVPTGVHYTVDGVYWWDDTVSGWLGNDDTFISGHSYSTQIFVQPDTGYSFDDTTELYINGSKSNVDLSFCQIRSSGKYEVWTTSNESEAPGPIAAVTLSDIMLPPPAGEKAGDCLTVNCGSSSYSVLYKYWYNDTSNGNMGDDAVFEEGNYYSMYIELVPATGYEFNSDTEIWINGADDLFDTSWTYIDSDGHYHIWTVSLECTSGGGGGVIPTLAFTGVTLVPPAGEDCADHLTVSYSSSLHISVINKYWYCDTTGAQMTSGDTFESGKFYSFHFVVVPDTGYSIDGTTVVTINGSTSPVDWNISWISSGGSLNVWTKVVTGGGVELTHIDTVDITGVTLTPVIGMRADDLYTANISSDTHASVTGVYWYNATDGWFMNDDDTFEAGKNYSIELYVEPDDGYQFTSSTVVKINGSASNVDSASTYGGINYIDVMSVVREAQAAVVYHTVTFRDAYNGKTIGTATVEHGGDVTLPTPPVHEGVVFRSWSHDGKNITSDLTIWANYDVATYTVTFVDGLTGDTISAIDVEHGADAPLPAPNYHEGYHFTSWDKDGKNITADTTITAQYAINVYTVIIKDGYDNTTLATKTVEHGADVTLPTPPTHTGYHFVSWSHDGKNITSDMTITAQYVEDEVVTHIVTFKDGYNDSIISTAVVEHGKDVTFPTVPTHTGYHFTGWDHNGKNITADITITAQFEINKYTVTFKDGYSNTVLGTTTVEHGADVTLPTPPAHTGYHFTSWDHTGKNITADITITALYAINIYTVTFKDGYNNTVISTTTVEHGKDVTFPTVPTHTGYHFTSWDKDGKNITADTTITAQYAINTYTVTFKDGYTNTVISTATVEHGADATFPTVPTHPGYHFTSWDKDGKNITADTTITAQYAINVYTVIIKDGYNNTTLATKTVEHGADVTLPTPPTHEGYHFVSWSHDGKNITSDMTITAQYAKDDVVTHIVTFKDDLTSEVFATIVVEHGADVVFPDAPTHPGYMFTHWSSDGKNITADTTITAYYKILEYTVTFVDGLTGIEFGTATVEYGSDVTFPEPPVHEGYTFHGWDNDGKNITADRTITALYDINTYTVTFVDGTDGHTFGTAIVEHGADVVFPTAPEHEGYTFKGWDNDGKNITADTTITAQYDVITFTVTFMDGLMNVVITTETVEYGKDAVFPEAPEHEGYNFIGWDDLGFCIMEDRVITANYEEIAVPTPTPTQEPTPTPTQEPTPTPTSEPTPTPTTEPTPTPTQEPEVMIGDLNGDGKINTADAVIILKIAAGMIAQDEYNTIAGDCNHDGKVNTADAVLILKYAAGMIEKF